jgi:hypothetical protein
MWEVVVSILLLLLLIGWLIVSCCTKIVPATGFAFMRHAITQRRRILTQGLNWVSPFEGTIVLCVPAGSNPSSRFSTFYGNRFRYDPGPYQALTRDHVNVFVDLSISYELDLEEACDFPVADFSGSLDKVVRSKTQQIISQILRQDINANDIINQLANVKWGRVGTFMSNVSVIVQDIRFDDHMQAILRAQRSG